MIDLDDRARVHLAQLQIPDGLGRDAVMEAGCRRRRLTRAATMVGTAMFLCMAVATLAWVGNRPARVEIAADPAADTAPAEAAAAGELPMADGGVAFFDVLPDRDLTAAPTVPTPSMSGWDVERSSLDLAGRYEANVLGVAYVLTRDSTVVDVSLLSGNFSVADAPSIELERPGGSVSGFTDRNGGFTTIRWNERPGDTTGMAATVRGADDSAVRAIAASVVFVDEVFAGAGAPALIELDAGRRVLLDGEVDQAVWQISDEGGDLVVEIGGQSPAVRFNSSIGGTVDIRLTSVSKDGLQVHLVEIPNGAEAFTLVEGERFSMLVDEEGTRSFAVAVIPPGKDAVAIQVLSGDSEQLVPLPLAPSTGWSVHRIESNRL